MSFPHARKLGKETSTLEQIVVFLDVLEKPDRHSAQARHLSESTYIQEEPGVYDADSASIVARQGKDEVAAPPLPTRRQPQIDPGKFGRHNPTILLPELSPGERYGTRDLETRAALENPEIIIYLESQFQIRRGFESEFVKFFITVPSQSVVSKWERCSRSKNSCQVLPSPISRDENHENHENHRRFFSTGQNGMKSAKRTEKPIDWYKEAVRLSVPSQGALECWIRHCVETWTLPLRHIPIFPRAICRPSQRKVLPSLIQVLVDEQSQEWRHHLCHILRDDEERYVCFLELAIEKGGVAWTAHHLGYWSRICWFRKDLAFVREQLLNSDVVNVSVAIVIDLYSTKDPMHFMHALESAVLLFESVVPMSTDALHLFRNVSQQLSRPEIFLCLAIFELARTYRDAPQWQRKFYDALPWDDIFEKNYFALYQCDELYSKAFTLGVVAGMFEKRWHKANTAAITCVFRHLTYTAWNEIKSFDDGCLGREPKQRRKDQPRQPDSSASHPKQSDRDLACAELAAQKKLHPNAQNPDIAEQRKHRRKHHPKRPDIQHAELAAQEKRHLNTQNPDIAEQRKHRRKHHPKRPDIQHAELAAQEKRHLNTQNSEIVERRKRLDTQNAELAAQEKRHLNTQNPEIAERRKHHPTSDLAKRREPHPKRPDSSESETIRRRRYHLNQADISALHNHDFKLRNPSTAETAMVRNDNSTAARNNRGKKPWTFLFRKLSHSQQQYRLDESFMEI